MRERVVCLLCGRERENDLLTFCHSGGGRGGGSAKVSYVNAHYGLSSYRGATSHHPFTHLAVAFIRRDAKLILVQGHNGGGGGGGGGAR